MKVRYRKHGHFHVPKHYLRGTICDEVDKVLANQYQADLDITAKHLVGKKAINAAPLEPVKRSNATPGYEREDYLEMEGVSSVSSEQALSLKFSSALYFSFQNIILGYERNPRLLFLIPTLFCWSFALWFTLAILELLLHMMSHHKNSLTMQKNLYFRSPLHVLSSQFCAICRNESDSKYNRTFDVLNKQMRLAHRTGALKNMTKAIA